MNSPIIRKKHTGSLIDVYVTPNSRKTLLAGFRDDGRLRISVSAQPEGGKANRALLKLFKSIIGESELVSGAKSRKKTVYVRDVEPADVMKLLQGVFKGV